MDCPMCGQKWKAVKDNDPVFWSDKLGIPREEKAAFFAFINSMAARINIGHSRYGTPNRRKNYKKRLEMEVIAYHQTGNFEHLMNIANYAWLESFAPIHPKFHHDATVDSVTRGRGLE